MQYSHGELIVPFLSGRDIHKALVRAYFGLMFYLTLFIASVVLNIVILISSHIVANLPGDREHQAFLFLFFLSTVVLPGWLLWMRFKYLAILRRKQRAPAEALRISHEGIYYSTSIPWNEVEAIFLYTITLRSKNHSVLGIVPRDYQAVTARFVHEHASGVFIRLIIWGTSSWISHESRFLAPINIA